MTIDIRAIVVERGRSKGAKTKVRNENDFSKGLCFASLFSFMGWACFCRRTVFARPGRKSLGKDAVTRRAAEEVCIGTRTVFEYCIPILIILPVIQTVAPIVIAAIFGGGMPHREMNRWSMR